MNNGEFDESIPQADQRPLGSGLGNDDRGHPCFDNQRTEIGEATYQLKYQKDWNQVGPLAQAVATNVFPRLDQVGFVVPMPASNIRQPGKSLKDLHSKAEKVAAIGNSFSINDEITTDGRWNVLVVDDLFDSGASMDAACAVLRKYPKVGKIYVAALTWK